MPVESGPLGRAVDDMVNLSQIVAAGQMYRMGAAQAQAWMARHPALQDVPHVRMERPYVMVPGWTTKPEKFDALVTRLTEGGRNGGRPYYVRDGRFFADKALTQPVQTVPPQARVFVQVFHDTLQPPTETAPQLERSVASIQKATGSDKVDVEGYSQGGLATRVYLDRGGRGVGKVLLLGTPNHGTRFSELSKRIIQRDIAWAMNMARLTVADLPDMEWLAAGANPQLADLNSRWEQQRSRAEGLKILGSAELPTPSRGLMPLRQGDGLVEARSLGMPRVEVEVLKGKPTLQHGALPSDSDVYRERAEFFGWTPERD
jgi:pimeloyl-ACP methyl ester carboxylesterase